MPAQLWRNVQVIRRARRAEGKIKRETKERTHTPKHKQKIKQKVNKKTRSLNFIDMNKGLVDIEKGLRIDQRN